jgi:putative transposase
VPDEDGIKLLLERVRGRFPRLCRLWVDAGYRGRGRRWAEEALDLSVEVVRASYQSRPRRRSCSPGRKSGIRRARRR